MQGRDGIFGDVLETVMASVEASDVQEQKIKDMVGFYAKMIEGNTPYDAIVKLAEEHNMKPEDVFALLKEGGHTAVDSLDDLKETEKTDEKIGEPKAEKVPTSGSGEHSKMKQLDAMGASTKHATDQVQKSGGPSQPKAKIGEPPAEKPPEHKEKGHADHSSLKQLDGMGASASHSSDQVQKAGGKMEGISPDDIDNLKEEDQIKTLTESDLSKDVAALSAEAEKALKAGEFDKAQDLVARLAQIQLVIPAKEITPPKVETPPIDREEGIGGEREEQDEVDEK
jgi:hypothetical protein